MKVGKNNNSKLSYEIMVYSGAGPGFLNRGGAKMCVDYERKSPGSRALEHVEAIGF